MQSAADVYAFFDGSVTAFGGVGIALSVALLLVLRFVVPTDRRRVVRWPLFLILLSIAIAILNKLVPGEEDALHRGLRLLHEGVLLLAVARSLYLVLLFGILERRKGKKRLLPGIFRDIVQVGIYVVAVLVLLRQGGLEASNLFTTSALLTAVIGLALQDTLGNLFAGLAIQVQEPFEVGDWIQFDDDTDHIGEVLEINWRATRILTIDRNEVTVPNNLIAKSPIRNYSRPTHLTRRNATVLAPYEAPPSRVHRLLAEAVIEVEGVRNEPLPDIQTVDFTERGIEYRIRYFIEDFHRREIIDSLVRDRLWYALRRASLPIPPPQRSVTLIEHSAATALADHAARVIDVERSLERVPLFAPLPHELLHEVALHTERRLYAPGEIVIQQGDHGQELFVVERGQLDVCVDVHDGMEHIATLTKDMFFGEMSLMTGEKRKATVRTCDEVTLLVVSKETLQPILEAAPSLAHEISEVLAQRELQLEGSRGANEKAVGRVEVRRGELLSRIREFFSI